LKKRVVFFEAEGGTDKGPDGHRRDTMPMVEALRASGWSAETLFYRDHERDELFDQVVAKADAYVSRINPGTIPGGEAAYFEMLRKLCDAGVVGMPHPEAMTGYGAKDALVKLVGTGLVPSDTTAYYTVDDFKKRFPLMLAGGRRVLKQNRGSTGEGIWLVSVDDPRSLAPGAPVPLDTRVKCVEAVDNHVEHHTLGEFMAFCEQYLVGDNGMLVDMRFMPRIKEGEIRILLVGRSPIFVVHKKPAEAADAFSATLFSGARYTYDEPAKWQSLVDMFLASLPEVMNRLGGHEIPLIWTADFMLDTAADGSDTYVLGEINCSCVGFTTHLEHGIQQKIAAEVIRRVERAGAQTTA
jgi:glutathione synthase/RimK-type ligase-like ATP-grasp enzyme